MATNTTFRQIQFAEVASQGLRPLLVSAERLAATVIMGEHGRKRAGPGDNFWQYRPYSFGDSTTRIDWRRSARSDSVFIRENEWQAANTLWLWANTSPRMEFTSLGNQSKKDRAVLLSLALANLALRADERIGVLGSAEAAGHGRSAFMRVANNLTGTASENLPSPSQFRAGNSAVIFSDFLDHPDEILKALLPFAASKTRGHLVQINDPAEETLPYDGRIEFIGMGNTERVLANRTQDLRSAYVEKFQTHRLTLRVLASQLGWSFTVHRTNQSASACLLALHHHISDNRQSLGRS